jgi:hypothetical protein
MIYLAAQRYKKILKMQLFLRKTFVKFSKIADLSAITSKGIPAAGVSKIKFESRKFGIRFQWNFGSVLNYQNKLVSLQ